MAEKIKNIFVCSNCDAQFPKWSGRCLECGAWGTLSGDIIDSHQSQKKELSQIAAADIIDLKSVAKQSLLRWSVGLNEVDRVLGGGLVEGSLILLGGEPGIGKSTLIAQVAGAVAQEKSVLYVSGEESITQVKARWERLETNLDNIGFVSETNLEKVQGAVEKMKPGLLIVDSIQTVYSSLLPSEAGAVNQIRACTVKFLEIAKQLGVTVVLIGHITKDGAVAGPKTLEHIVDVVMYLESNSAGYSILRAQKNRFGSVNEVGIMEMTGQGFKEVKNISSVFIDQQMENIAGSVVSSIMEGSRPFLVNIQALVSKTVFGYPQRKAAGFDSNRLQILSAVLDKKTKLKLATHDIIMNVVGGMKINDPGLDLAVCLAIASSVSNQALPAQTIILGEVGLGGEVRAVQKIEQKLTEAHNLGFKRAVVPNVDIKQSKLELIRVQDVNEAITKLIEK